MTSQLFPPAATEAAADAIEKTVAPFSAGLRVLGPQLGLPAAGWQRFALGSCPVFHHDDHVLKLFAPPDHTLWQTEVAVLECLTGHAQVPAPRLRGHGTLDGWSYVWMSRLPGIALADAWNDLDPQQRGTLMHQVGALVANLRQVNVTGLRLPPPPWDGFVHQQRSGCLQRQRDTGLDEPWLRQVEPFLARTPLPHHGAPVLLHTELMRQHLLVEERNGQMVLCGVVDFEPAMVGNPEYELASLGLFVTCGQPGLLAQVLAGMDASALGTDPGFAQRCMAWALLHRYSRLRWYLEVLPTDGERTLEELARQWWQL